MTRIGWASRVGGDFSFSALGFEENLERKKQIKGSGQECPLHTGHGENALALHWKYRICRGPSTA